MFSLLPLLEQTLLASTVFLIILAIFRAEVVIAFVSHQYLLVCSTLELELLSSFFLSISLLLIYSPFNTYLNLLFSHHYSILLGGILILSVFAWSPHSFFSWNFPPTVFLYTPYLLLTSKLIYKLLYYLTFLFYFL